MKDDGRSRALEALVGVLEAVEGLKDRELCLYVLELAADSCRGYRRKRSKYGPGWMSTKEEGKVSGNGMSGAERVAKHRRKVRLLRKGLGINVTGDAVNRSL